MLTPTNYAVIVVGPFFEVRSWNRRDRTWDLTNERLYRSRADCRPIMEWLMSQDSDTYDIVEYSHAYRCHCVICGDPPDYDEVYLFPDWHELVAYVASYPGWVTTSEVLIFCPDHRPLREE
ncbi:hypothetical protein DL990_30425 [Amycolatopsis sp. WAC 01416]|uniref:hypothetical protein n=1 Tax=Amycolatopsis sp. WAC 01416 TaxID=2203196 RepID=UPI000F778984|nr:hypothetical protein [Amycolatopsis sp. WAC 01416]RSN27493.1 hypothetical protein DL990_30425 [Amycolatopsis sp. WAC 01416]